MYNNPYNFYPYMNQMAMQAPTRAATGAIRGARGGLFKSLANIKWGNVLNNTQKTLNVINQAIPVYYQIKPIWGNLKSFGKIMSAFNEPDNNVSNNNINQTRNEVNQPIEEKKENSNTPTFFIN